ncbi:MAG: homocysteine S-methyltransferase family protein [Thermodesulfobacteriota bacterium]|nr:homocysteine S-methyltransferase family protein [Thermodesulfobacteriota bacterium]
MSIQKVLEKNDLILTEAAVIEELRRSDEVDLHPRLENALLIYNMNGRRALRNIYKGFISIAQKANIPINICTPTWRANRERVLEAHIKKDINGDSVKFLKDLGNEWGDFSLSISIGGLIGCKNDSYKPKESLQQNDAYSFHSWQIEKLSKHGIDYLMAATLPSVSEAVGIALAMEKTKIPYFISFVINRVGKILDGSSLKIAFDQIDAKCTIPPLGYMVNCAYPSFLNLHEQPKCVIKRLIGFQGNSSSLDHEKLDGSSALQSDPLEDWGDKMIELNKKYGLKILGGCCGTNINHLKYIARSINQPVV